MKAGPFAARIRGGDGGASVHGTDSTRNVILSWSRSRKRLTVLALDSALSIFATWLAFTLRLDVAHWPRGVEWVTYLIAPCVAIPIFVRFGLYRAIFRYTGVAAMLTTGKAVIVYGLFFMPIVWALFLWGGVPRSLGVLQPLILLILVTSSRAVGWHWLSAASSVAHSRVLIYGAGSAGAQTAAALASTRQYLLLGFLDDDLTKVGRSINGVQVVHARDASETVARHGVTDIVLALPSVTRGRRNQVINTLQTLPVRIRSVPALGDLASGRVGVGDFQDLDIEDLLGRDPVAVRPELLATLLQGRTVLVTGAGGSIGGELCRQIVLERPASLVLVEHSEYALYRIHQELQSLLARHGQSVALHPVLADVCNEERMRAICARHRPAVVYHAAAYKHVPMVESNAGAGVFNNVQGTLSAARAAIGAGAARFVLVSTDKAVRPTNVMGASKRIAELILQALASQPDARTCFSMVRFGNVLGSSGSVVPLFRAQIAEGGPITITDPEVTRYFMTIPEAAQLVLHAGAMAEGGDLFVLDMGKPVRILDLARRMVALSGLTVRDDRRPTGDIAIAYMGLRPGEKLYEELLIGENPLPTDHPRIIRAREEFLPWTVLESQLEMLLTAARTDNATAMKSLLRALVPGYAPDAARAD